VATRRKRRRRHRRRGSCGHDAAGAQSIAQLDIVKEPAGNRHEVGDIVTTNHGDHELPFQADHVRISRCIHHRRPRTIEGRRFNLDHH
jgi:hypothetical protein